MILESELYILNYDTTPGQGLLRLLCLQRHNKGLEFLEHNPDYAHVEEDIEHTIAGPFDLENRQKRRNRLVLVAITKALLSL